MTATQTDLSEIVEFFEDLLTAPEGFSARLRELTRDLDEDPYPNKPR